MCLSTARFPVKQKVNGTVILPPEVFPEKIDTCASAVPVPGSKSSVAKDEGRMSLTQFHKSFYSRNLMANTLAYFRDPNCITKFH